MNVGAISNRDSDSRARYAVGRKCNSLLRRPYFSRPERIGALRSALHTWRGTRWQHAGNRPNEMKCGITGDCLFWVKVFKEIGALPSHLEIPPYRKMEAAADKMQRLRDCIEATGLAELVWRCSHGGACPDFDIGASRDATTRLAEAQPHLGDVLLLSNGMSGVHCGLVVQTVPLHFVHLSQHGLLEEPLNQGHWITSLAYVYRLLEPAETLNPEP